MNSSPITDAALDGLIERLAGATTETDQAGTWPSEQLGWFAESGVFRWVIPAEFGGLELSPAEIVRGYERLAEGCLTSTFILTQRNGACQRIAGCDNDELKSDVLPGLAEGRLFATVGISHLTTSRQHVRTPPVRVRLRGDIVELDGEVPWVTGARPADFIVTGGACDDRRQVLIAVPTQLPGVEPHEPARLLALTGSQTGSVRLQNVTLSRQHVLAGPVENVMRTGEGGGAGSVATSALAVGLARRAIGFLRDEAIRRPDLITIAEPFQLELETLHRDLHSSSGTSPAAETPVSPESLRRRANSCCLRATQAMLGASKGAGFVAGHPAEQAVREAMFFLVWSCPQPVLTAALRQFACLVD